MPLDAVCLTAVLQELRPRLEGARVDKIQQPEKDKLLLSVRGREGNGKLLLAAGTGSARLHFTGRSYDNPQSPPMFCMLLRKHLQGAKIAEVVQPPMERIVQLVCDTYDELGEPCRKTLVLELLGKYCNLILVDGEGIILDALRRVDEDMSRTRRVLPGLRYRLPEAQGKLDPLGCAPGEIAAALDGAPEEVRLDKWLLDTFFGLSPLVCRELADRAFGQSDIRFAQLPPGGRETFAGVLEELTGTIREGAFAPWLLTDGGRPFDFTYLPVRQYGARLTLERADSFSALLEGFYERRDREDRLRQRGGALIKSVTNLRDRTARKLGLQREELKSAGERTRLRELGDILTANLHVVEKGAQMLTAQDFYDPEGGEVTIELDPLKTPQQNAAAYYKKYNKLKAAEAHLTEQIARGELELEYLDSVLDALGKAETLGDIAEIRQELADAGLIKRGGTKKQRDPAAKPLVFRSSTGMDIYVGKNNIQNDKLTFRTARRGDMWLHTQKIHGSHVIVPCAGEPPDATTLEEAAVIAAWYSQGREGTKVPVDYTPVKNVKKPGGGRPGMAHYVDYKTIYVNPDEALVNRLRR